ncbi:MAG: hypothetical protein K0V04_22925 [Deltaproteobacteria bacterium]|nr:hypothetical protein [Deltaproteobacteria bacterium]
MSVPGRVFAAVFSVGLLVAMFVPILRDPPRDGFPLSNYPMFSEGKKKARAEIGHVVGFSREGRHRPLSPDILGTEEVMQAHQTVRVAIRKGATAALCRDTADRVAESSDHGDLERLEVRTDVYDAIEYFAGDKSPRSTRVHASCSVPEAP